MLIQEKVCDKCGLKADRIDDPIEWQEFLTWENVGGYGAIFGDGAEMRLDLCQQCVKDVLGDYVKIVGQRYLG